MNWCNTNIEIIDFAIIPPWFIILGIVFIFLYALAKKLQDLTKKTIVFLGFILEGFIVLICIFLIQYRFTQALSAKPVIDVRVDTDTRILTIKNNGLIPVQEVYVSPTIYVTTSKENFTASTTRVSFNRAINFSKKINRGEQVEINLDDGKNFLFYDHDTIFTPLSKKLINDYPTLPMFFTPFGTTTVASSNNIYYFFRVSFINALTKEHQVRYTLITAQKSSNWFNSIPSDVSSGFGTMMVGDYSTIQKQLDIKELIFKQQQTHWHDSESQFYDSF